MGPLDPNLGLRTPVESYMRATEVAFKVGDAALFPTSTHAQRMPSRPTSIRVRVRVRFTKMVYQTGLTTFFRSQG